MSYVWILTLLSHFEADKIRYLYNITKFGSDVWFYLWHIIGCTDWVSRAVEVTSRSSKLMLYKLLLPRAAANFVRPYWWCCWLLLQCRPYYPIQLQSCLLQLVAIVPRKVVVVPKFGSVWFFDQFWWTMNWTNGSVTSVWQICWTLNGTLVQFKCGPVLHSQPWTELWIFKKKLKQYQKIYKRGILSEISKVPYKDVGLWCQLVALQCRL